MHYHYEDMDAASMKDDAVDMEAVAARIKDTDQKQDAVEYTVMMDNLKMLDNWCKEHKKEAFFEYFQDAMIGAYFRYRRAKAKAWPPKKEKPSDDTKEESGEEKAKPQKKWDINWKELLFDAIPTIGIPTIFSIVTAAVSFVNSTELDLNDYLQAFAVGAVVGIPLAIISTLKRVNEQKQRREETKANVERELEKKHNYYETWVRHTLCHSRLQIALSKFIVSERTDNDYNELVGGTFQILEQNLDQFAINTCPRGMAFRPGKTVNEKRTGK